ncbi:S-adenosyl-L-methionine-dependent methyltransferase [Irpex rosettiformis]|uniref:S-adenosyl-L-methionine-dependent methyltransferase n=1 Tax=Irpex rosettiformis TaxID=378272 RepID=A0ACB8UAB8_9APHY|nr:S-adenosyl-L-methionine-dependent methyltransferase [Irpex rosettiformis]
MASRSESKDVHDELKNARRRKRIQDEKPYPVAYSNDQVAYDNWNHMFLKSLSQGLTLRQYDTPPKDILDLGCGSGLWVMDAAQQWPSSNFIGYDCLHIQPNLKVFGSSQPGLEDLAKRIKWMCGNFLDPLPFKANSFDFVRICCIGLGVPEDEWQTLLQEVTRVLKPGAFVEIVEEDLIFPASGDSIKETGTPVTRRLKPLLEPSLQEQNGSNGTSRTSNTSIKSPSVIASTLARFHNDSPQQTTTEVRPSSPFPRPTISELLNPRDHSILKAAWDEMLHKRFLAPGLLSVLHFYFAAEFEEVQTHPTVRILLPPNSRMTFSSVNHNRGRSTSISTTLDGVTVAISHVPGSPRSVVWSLSDYAINGYGPRREDAQGSSPVVTASWSAMHLSRAFSTVQGSKDAVWLEYKELAEPSEDDPDELYQEFLASWAHWER